ncbi:hypothetical protein HMPREF1207_05605 [Paenibacillus sp. HGH0039]|nr:hypothetical protein HMPREF1207_05605 [Paenibacillus sp. HGH0039]
MSKKRAKGTKRGFLKLNMFGIFSLLIDFSWNESES